MVPGLLIAFSVAFGSDLARDRATLRGLTGVWVVVEELDSDIEARVPVEEIESEAVRTIKGAGIPLIKTDFLQMSAPVCFTSPSSQSPMATRRTPARLR
jgi:hypothetical protein